MVETKKHTKSYNRNYYLKTQEGLKTTFDGKCILIFNETSRTVFEPFSIILHSQSLLSGSTSVLG